MSLFSQIILGRARNSVQVHFRVCPPTAEDGGHKNIEINKRRKSITNVSSNKEYKFDGVYGPESSQEEVFDNIASPVVDDCLKGYNCTILCYGQIGTGKTYTMEGKQNDEFFDEKTLGIIPRAIHRIYCILQKACPSNVVRKSDSKSYLDPLPSPSPRPPRAGAVADAFYAAVSSYAAASAIPYVPQFFSAFKDDGTTMGMINGGNEVTHYSIKVSNVEIYNDELRDLLADPSNPTVPTLSSSASLASLVNTPTSSFASSSFSSPAAVASLPQKLQVRGTPDLQGFYVHGLEEKLCETPEEAFRWFQIGCHRRTIGPTIINPNSSRGHSIFIITVTLHEFSFAGGDEREIVGKLNLVDLAGGDNVERSGVSAREIGRINRDLLSLSRCIAQIAEKKRAEDGLFEGGNTLRSGGSGWEGGSTLRSGGSGGEGGSTLKSGGSGGEGGSTLKSSSKNPRGIGSSTLKSRNSLKSPARTSPSTGGTIKSKKLANPPAPPSPLTPPPASPSTPPPQSPTLSDANAGGTLSSAANFVNFRDCKLTEILQSSLGGNYCTTLIATLSQSSKYLAEVEQTLALGSKAKMIENHPEVNQRLSARNRLNALAEENTVLQKRMNALMRGIAQEGEGGGSSDGLMRLPSSTWNDTQAELERAKAEAAEEKRRWEETQGELNGVREREKLRRKKGTGEGGDETWTQEDYQNFLQRLKQAVEECVEGVERAEGGIVKNLEEVKGELDKEKGKKKEGGEEGEESGASSSSSAAAVAAVRFLPPHLAILYSGLDVSVDGSLTSIVTTAARFTKKLRDLVNDVEELEEDEASKEIEIAAEEKKKKTEARIKELLAQIRQREKEKKRRDEDELDKPIDEVIRIMQGMKAYRQERKLQELKEDEEEEKQKEEEEKQKEAS